MGEHLGHGIRIVPRQPRVREGVEAAESCWVLQSRESRDATSSKSDMGGCHVRPPGCGIGALSQSALDALDLPS